MNGLLCDSIDDSGPEDTYEIHVGRALDKLRNDYPLILTDSPEFSIYDETIEIIDPSGVKLNGIKNYKNVFSVIHAIVNVFYCPEHSSLTFRLCYDKARHNIRVQWNAEVIPKAIFGGVRSTLYVDGISIYEIDRDSGMIYQHRLERLLMNDMPLQPQQGVFAALQSQHKESVPMYSTGVGAVDGKEPSNFDNTMVKFQGWKSKAQAATSLFSMSSASSGGLNEADAASTELQIDLEAFEKKNISRKKFGLKPLSPEEYIKVEEEVKQMEVQQRQRAAASSQAAAELAAKKEKQNRPNFFDKVLGNVLKDTCEDNYDCERPEVCCDFGFKKMCCASGMGIVNGPQSLEGQPALVPVPIEPSPPDYGRSRMPPNRNYPM